MYEITGEDVVERALKCLLGVHYVFDGANPHAHEQLLLTLQCELLEDENSSWKLTKTSKNFLAKLKAHE